VNTFGQDEEEGGVNRRVLMLLSAFHVSAPTQVYKHWLNAALHHLFKAKEIQADCYLNHLESVAKSFVFDRFLAQSNGLDYFEMIYCNNGECQTVVEHLTDEVLASKLIFERIRNNLVFNYLDYLLWLKHRDVSVNSKVKAFTFTFRSSVEHYHPQNPKHRIDILPDAQLNSFGNLCLISHSRNSMLSNDMPTEKRKHYENSPTIDSVKQHLMMADSTWDAAAIDKHYKYVVSVLLEGPRLSQSSTEPNQV
jgi:hypothetical protein